MFGIVLLYLDLFHAHFITLFYKFILCLFIIQIFIIRFRACSAEPVQCPIMRSALAGWPSIKLAGARHVTSPLSLIPDARRRAGIIFCERVASLFSCNFALPRAAVFFLYLDLRSVISTFVTLTDRLQTTKSFLTQIDIFTSVPSYLISKNNRKLYLS